MGLNQGFEQQQQQKQLQKLALTQQMRQSIQMLKYNAEDLQKFLIQKELENPFIIVKKQKITTEFTVQEQKDDWTQYATKGKQPSLFEYLLEQVHLTMRATPLRSWLLFLIARLDSNGYLKANLEQIKERYEVSETMLLDALTLLQQLDPPGVGARNLQECLMLQADLDYNAPDYTYEILRDDFDDFIEKNWSKIAKKYQIALPEVQKIFDYVRTLSPVPGAAYNQDEIGYIYPDIIINVDQKNNIHFELTKEAQPEISFRQEYYDSLTGVFDEQVMQYLKEKKKEYQQLSKDLLQRSSTLKRVTEQIIIHQSEFFINSKHPLKPFLLRDVAQSLQLHESTISRAVNGKYLKTSFGTFELKHFFSQAVNHHGIGEDVTASAIQTRILALIADENKQKPLSDQKIVELLAQEGLNLSRRTVAKYRDVLGIPSSSKRKRFE
ncbi:RNA polymerase factor sigma-54 [Ligilactobacillus sp. Marseille-Q7487]|uniref:RNA polymerase factor sigma-54 n=1 Tax=Ligilactobacillus sp. Marseille-Q7487 TaxID=3022128 RepID=UPI0024A96087|nr:RNA polymerase factor sigma-54 [Ligilactobacillus sp. Marseille-Q7487]